MLTTQILCRSRGSGCVGLSKDKKGLDALRDIFGMIEESESRKDGMV